MLIKNAQNIYMVGIKGFGMSSLATVLVKMGKRVSGSDVDTRFPTDSLLDESGIERKIGFKPENVPADCDLVITTGAYGGLNNPEVVAARERGIKSVTHAEALGSLMDVFKHRIAICGSHGKTTTSSMMAYVLFNMGLKMGYQVGVPSFSGMLGGDYTGDDYFVVESDEYVASPGIDNTPRFMFQNPNYALCMNIDLDHVDVYPDLESIKHAYRSFFEKVVAQDGLLVYCRDDENAHEVALSIKGLTSISYGTHAEAQVKVDGNKISFNDGTVIDLKLKLPGLHNVLNAAGVLSLIHELNLSVTDAAKLLGEFTGSQLRYETLLNMPEYVVINDYGHHPAEVKATIQAARSQYPSRRLIAVFHPHTLSRTRYFKDAFVEELSKADKAFVLDIFASARDDNDGSFTSEMMVHEAHGHGITTLVYLPQQDAVKTLMQSILPGDVILFIGAGDKYYIYNDLIKQLQPSS